MVDPDRDDLAVIDYYDIVGPVMQKLWDDNFHFGYWDDPGDTSTVAAATDRFTDLVIGRLAATAGARVLDLGCGIGKPALRLARAAEVEVVGITVSHDQVEQANDRARREGLAGRVSFQVADGTDMPFPDDSFDAVLAFESILHMDRGRALREVGRVLRPGGRLVATDLVERATPDQVTPPANATFTPLPLLARYPDLLAESGLEPVELLDVTANTVHLSLARMMSASAEDQAAFAATMDPARQQAVAAANMPLTAAVDLGCVLVVATATAAGDRS
ncbi:SAM-dependent methyltransferase [Paractinoplanes deccanensis]|uniref:SAM-dependent methyltransferase n=1 Tax=Paractinoplanes deccanensis TaxID=113561 RepID=UPI0019429735|nr:methyltransferase domain-containing protein [Actinoplanes deccanensis]